MIGEPIPVNACSLDDEALAARARRWRSEVEPAVIERRPVEGGFLTRLRRVPGVEEDILDLVRLEAECCPHLSFRVTTQPGEILLTVSFGGP